MLSPLLPLTFQGAAVGALGHMVLPRQFCCPLCCKLLLLIINKTLKSSVLVSLGPRWGGRKGPGPGLEPLCYSGSFLEL